MNTKTYSVLLCVLLASNLIHEIRTKGVGPDIRKKRSPNLSEEFSPYELDELEVPDVSEPLISAAVAPVVAQAESAVVSVNTQYVENQQCRWVCNTAVTETTKYIFAVNTKANLYGFLSNSYKSAFTLDSVNQLVALSNGVSGETVIINYASSTLVYLKSSTVSNVWHASQSSYESYLFGLTCLSGLYEKAQGIRYPLNAITDENVLRIIRDCVINVGAIGANSQIDSINAFGIIEQVANYFFVFFNLEGGYQFEHSHIIKVNYGLTGFANLFGIFNSWSKYLSPHYFSGIDFPYLFDGNSAVDNFDYLITQAGSGLDIGSSCGPLLNNPSDFLFLLAGLGGYTNGGAPGLYRWTGILINYLSGEPDYTLERVIFYLLLFVTSDHDGLNLDSFFVDFGSIFDIFQNNPGFQNSLEGFLNFGNSFKQGSYITNGVNVYSVLDALLQGIREKTNPLELVISVLVHFQSLCSVSSSVSSLLLVLIANANYGYSNSFFEPLGISLPGLDSHYGSGFLSQALSGADLSNFPYAGIYDSLCNVPQIAPIVQTVETVISQQTHISLSTVLANSRSQGVRYIKGYLQFALGVSLRVSSTIISQVQTITQNITGYDLYSGCRTPYPKPFLGIDYGSPEVGYSDD